MKIAHLTASQFLGGPERQMLGLARALPRDQRTSFISFSEGGRCRAFLEVALENGFTAMALRNDTPHILAARDELAHLLERLGTDVLCCHGYKANIVGRLAARRAGVPVVAVSRGWTGDCWRVRCYEVLDRLNLRWMDRVVCVSEAQAVKVRRAGVAARNVLVVPNAICAERFEEVETASGDRLREYFPSPKTRIVGAAGRLSPEKGFAVLVDAAARVIADDPSVGFVLFGDGPLRRALARRIVRAGLNEHFVLAGFRSDMDSILPFLDLLVLPSWTEGLPNVVLEAFAARVPVVATAVGGTPEVIDEGQSGFLVAPGDSGRMAERISEVLAIESRRLEMGERGYLRVCRDFTFAAQGDRYRQLFEELTGFRSAPRPHAPRPNPVRDPQVTNAAHP